MEDSGIDLNDFTRPLPGPEELTPALIEEIKAEMAQYGLPPRLFKYTCEGRAIVWRPLFRFDWNEINAFVQSNNGNVRQEDVDRKICEKAICWPQDITSPFHWDFQPAGLQSSLAKQVLSRSGFFDPEIDQSAYLKVEPLTTVERGPKPDEKIVAELKGKFPNWALKLVCIEGDHYVVRPLNRAEWKKISGTDDADLDLATAERATVWSREYPATPNFADRVAGTVRTLSEVIMRISGFVSEASVEEL